MGNIASGIINAIGAAEAVSVNLVVADLIWAIVYPVMGGVNPASLRPDQHVERL